MSALESFRAAMAAAGLRYDGPLVVDGRLHRVCVDGDRRPNSWFVLHAGPPVAGAFGCWKRGINETWCQRKGNDAPGAWQRIREAWQQAEQERRRAEQDLQKKARRVAERILRNSTPATKGHPYLQRKGVGVHGELRQWRGALVLPVRGVDGQLHSLQFIVAAGEKRFLQGGRVRGCCFALNDNPTGPLVVAEGYATAASIDEATGFSVVASMNAGNLLAVAQALRQQFPRRDIIIAADNDAWTDGNPGLSKAREAALAVGARLAVPVFRDTSAKPTDFNDLARLDGLEAVRRQIEAATVPAETDDEILASAASLPVIQYERAREQLAEKLRIRVGVLDAEVEKRRPRNESTDHLQGRSLKLPEPDPWPEPVDGGEVLSMVSQEVSSYIALPDGAADAIALWCGHCFCYTVFDHSPRLNITSPEKRCGKTTARDVIGCLVPRPLAVENLTTAVIFRVVESHAPTLLVDECDGWLAENPEAVSLLNSGHRRGGQALRCEGDDHEVRAFGVFAPAVLCGIGNLPGTLADRSICIRLERAAKHEVRCRFDSRRTGPLQELARKFARWCMENRDRLAGSDPVLPESCFGRLADNWRPLFAIAEVAGGDWPCRAAAAFAALSEQQDENSIGETLLADIKAIFGESKVDRMSSTDLVERL
ncbi:MAG: DUF3631 domain-containing protein, partial [Verrucomicrobiia bacterium]